MDNIEAVERHWPYANSFTLETLDSTVIQAQAEAVLSRVLTAGRAIAFVGSGVSDCYGRMSWTEMVYRLQERALERGREATARGRVARLYESLKRDPIKRASTARSDALPIRAELAIRLYDEATAPSGTVGSKAPSARDLVKQDIVDDSGHARSLLFDGLSGALGETARASLRDKLDRLDKHRLRAIFSCHALDSLLEPLPADGADTLATRLFQLTQEVARRPADEVSSNRVLKSRRRFLLALALAANPAAHCRDSFLGKKLKPLDRPRRFHFVERERDPLMLLYDELGFRRFITTNYDREIERLFRDKGLTLTGDVTAEADQPGDDLGPAAVGQATARVIVYDQTKAGGLVAFAAQDKLRGPGLVYLHGRAADEDDIVVGEADYRELYLKQTPYRALSQAALELTFGANPIIFLGLGMNEDDVLRPLRDFMSGRESLSQRPVIAIMPQPVDLADGATKASNLLARYGVLTLYYGSQLVTDRTPGSAKDRVETVPWMAQAFEIIKSCRALGEQIGKGDDDERLDELREKLRTAFAVLGDAPDKGEWFVAPPRNAKDVPAALDLSDDLRFLSVLAHGLFHARGDGSIKAMLPAIGGTLSAIHSSIQGAFLCERIAKLRTDRNTWFEHWMFLNRDKSPPSNPLGLDHINSVKEWNRPHERWEKSKLDAHKLDKLTSLKQVRSFGMPELEVAPKRTERTVSDVPAQRFYAGAVSQTFNNLLAALEDHSDIRSVQRRRTFLFVGRRGLGRGHFIAALKSPQRISELSYRLCDKTKWHSAGFYSIAHTTDFADVVSDISMLLMNYLKGVASDRQNALKEELHDTVRGMKELGEAKMDSLAFGLSALGDIGTRYGPLPRLLLVLNSFDILYDEFGNEKNASIRRFASLLSSELLAGAPLDLIVVCNEQNIPNQFRDGTDGGPTRFVPPVANGEPRYFSPLLLRTEQLDVRARQALANRVAAFPIKVSSSLDRGEYLHVLRGARASIVMTSFFPRLALMFGVGIGLKLGMKIERGIGNDRRQQRQDWASLILDVRNEIEGRKKDDDAPYGGSTTKGPRRGDLGLAGERAVGKLVSILRGNPGAGTPKRPLLVGARGAALTDAEARGLYSKLDEALRQMAKLSGGRRYALTLLAATAFDMSSDYIRGPQQKNTKEELAWFEKTCGDVTEFLQANTTILASQEAPERDTAIVRLCLDELRRRHEQFRALPLEIPAALANLGDSLLGPDMFSLQHTVLWHLAAFGQPVSLDALKRCPSLDEVATQLAMRSGAQTRPVSDLLEFALEVLVNRCLVMQIEGLAGKLFTVHRTVQLHLLRHLGSPSVEYQTVNQFTVTSYMTQPRDMPRLRREAHHELRRTISALIDYPNADGRSEQVALFREATVAEPASKGQGSRVLTQESDGR